MDRYARWNALLEMLTERARSYCFVSNTLLNTPALEVAITD